MLELRPGCECCDRDLPADSLDARICSFECTFCRACAESELALPQLRRRTGEASDPSGRKARTLSRFRQTCAQGLK